MRELVVKGTLTIPLYHGTSSLFAGSIGAKGLGACNPIADFGVVQFLGRTYTVCQELFAADEEWMVRRVVIEPMIRQAVTAGGFNFQHGDSYLTPSRSSAVGYALSNPFGSELISQAFFLFRMVEARRPGEIERRGIKADLLLKLFGQSPLPYLVTARNVPVVSLAGECGGPVEETIRTLAPMVDTLNAEGATININFRLLSPLQPNLLVIEQIDPNVEENPYRD